MAYTTIPEIEIAAGGPEALLDLSDYDKDGHYDDAVIRQAQRDADSWIDSYARRLYEIPFQPVPDAIRALAGDETVYRLRKYLRLLTELDEKLKTDRDALMQGLLDGKWNPIDTGQGAPGTGDGDGSGAAGSGTGVPYVGVYSSDDPAVMTRENLKGYW